MVQYLHFGLTLFPLLLLCMATMGLSTWTTFPPRMWWPMMRIGAFLARSKWRSPINFPRRSTEPRRDSSSPWGGSERRQDQVIADSSLGSPEYLGINDKQSIRQLPLWKTNGANHNSGKIILSYLYEL